MTTVASATHLKKISTPDSESHRMAYLCELADQYGGPRHVLFHPHNWLKDPNRLRKVPFGTVKPHEFIYDIDAARRGELLPADSLPKQLRLWTNRKQLLNFFMIQSGLWGASEEGGRFLQREAPGDTELVPVTIVPKKLKEPALEQKFYWLNFMRRLDSIVWDKTNIRFSEHQWVDDEGQERGGIDAHFPTVDMDLMKTKLKMVMKSSAIGDTQIWHETFRGSNAGYRVFVSNRLRDKLVESKICRFDFVKIDEE
jgi:hypothetical protein